MSYSLHVLSASDTWACAPLVAQMVKKSEKVKVSQSCLTLCDPMDYTVHEILQARILEWVAFPCSRGSSQLRDQTQVSCSTGGFLPAMRETWFDPWVGKILWRRPWQHTPVFLPGESPWTEESCGLRSMGSQRVGHH